MRQAVYSFIVLVLCCFCATVAQAEDGQDLKAAVDAVVASEPVVESDPWKFKLTETWVSKYVGYPGPLLSDKPCLQSDLSVVAPSGWHASIWWSTGLAHEQQQTPAEQVDIAVGKTWKWNDGSWLTADLIYKDFTPLGRSAGDAFVPRVKLGRDMDLGAWGKLKPYLQAECWLILPDLTRRSTVTLGLDYALPIVGPLSLKAGVSGLYDWGTPATDRGPLGKGILGLEYKVSGHLSLGIGYSAFAPHDRATLEHQEVLGLSLTLNL